jgi:hypothetical protein
MIDLKRFVGRDVSVQLKAGESWFFFYAPPKHSKQTMPQLMTAPDENGREKGVQVPFVQGTVNADGDLLVPTPHGGVVLVAIDASTIASVTEVKQHAQVEERSTLIVPGN